MKNKHVIGADLSKKSIDLFSHELKEHICIKNESSGFKSLIKWCKVLKIDLLNTIIIMEHTGLYSFCFEEYLFQQKINFIKVNALEIKRSLGLVRGKTDKIDAKRIAGYGYEKRDKLQLQTPLDNNLKRLQLLLSTKDRFIKQRAGLTCAITEYRNIGLKDSDPLIKYQLKIIEAFNSQISKLQIEMDNIVEQNESLNKNYQLLQTIKGVGKVLSLATIIKTNNFERFTTARKFACYCGTAPFAHESGSSIRKKTHISHLADKHMKTLLDLAAKSAIQYDKESKEFYERRLGIGKSKMSTINIVRNKIIYRMFAIIKRQTPFIQDYIQAA